MEEASKSASSRQDITTLREELQTLAKQSQPHAQPLEPVTKCETSTSDSQQVASTSPEMQQMHQWLSKLEEDVKALTADPHVNELCPGSGVEGIHEARTRGLNFMMSRVH